MVKIIISNSLCSLSSFEIWKTQWWQLDPPHLFYSKPRTHKVSTLPILQVRILRPRVRLHVQGHIIRKWRVAQGNPFFAESKAHALRIVRTRARSGASCPLDTYFLCAFSSSDQAGLWNTQGQWPPTLKNPMPWGSRSLQSQQCPGQRLRGASPISSFISNSLRQSEPWRTVSYSTICFCNCPTICPSHEDAPEKVECSSLDFAKEE